MRCYKTVQHRSEVEIIINKSRFIGRCWPVATEEEALELLAAIRKQHYDASHNCYAYRIAGGAQRFSDDGEPGGTAGMPMVEVLKAREVENVLCIVTRYFGGVLLGAGGLVRAYSRSAAEAVEAAGVVELRPGRLVEIKVDYSRYGALEGFVRSAAQVEGVEFTDDVTIRALVEEGSVEDFTAAVVERTDGRCTPVVVGESYITVSEF